MSENTKVAVHTTTSLSKKQEAKYALFKSKGIENLVLSHNLIPLGDGKYKLVALKDQTPEFGNISGSTSRGSSYGSRLLGNDAMTQDEQKLFILNGGIDCSIELKEAVSVGKCCL